MRKKNIKLDDLGFEEISATKEQGMYESNQKTDIAVIGISANIAGLENQEELWCEGLNGQNVLAKSFPEERFEDIKDYLKRKGVKNPQPNMFTKEAYLEDISHFDAKFFNVLPNDAVMLEPAQRIMLEHAWNAFLDAGYSQKSMVGSQTGIFIGYSVPEHNYQEMMKNINKEAYDKNLAGTVNSVIASRISYYFDLKGPALMIDTACSSSLSAVHVACQSLLSGECKMALAGGVKYYLLPEQKREEDGLVSVVSLDGKTKTFDNSADGTNPGEGVAAVLLKPLNKALSDKDHIYAVIKATAVNQDGASVGITAPNSKAQKEVICTAWEKAKINPETVTYIEAHGTGTKLGDPVEITGISTAFAEYTKKKNFCAVSSIKSGIGHLDCSAGVIGLIRVILAMKYRQIPGSLHFKVPNKKIQFIDSAVYVNDCLKEWDVAYPRRAGISSFGISGTNCHVLLEEAPLVKKNPLVIEEADSQKPYLLTLSVKDKKSKKELFDRYIRFFENTKESLKNICYTSNISRSEYGCRYAFILQDKKDFPELVQKLLDGQESEYVRYQENGMKIPEHSSADEKARELCKELEVKESLKDRLKLLKELADTYVIGADIDLEQQNIQKVSLPTYPYHKQKYWIEAKESVLVPEQDATYDMLFGRKLVDSLDLAVFENIMSTKTHTELKEHVIGNTHVLAGTVYVEMIHRAIEEISGSAQMEIDNLVFQIAMTCEPDRNRLVHIVVMKEEEQYKVSIQSTYTDEQNWIKHVSASARIVNMPQIGKTDIKKEEDRIRSQMIPHTKSSTKTLVQVGPRWNPEKEIIASDTEVFATIKVPDDYKKEHRLYHIYPPMLDASVNAAGILNGEKLYLPYYFGKIRIYGRMPEQCFSLLKKRVTEGEDAEITTFDGKVVDSSGSVIVEIEHYSMKETHEKEREQFMKQTDLRYHMLYLKKNKLKGEVNKIGSCVVIRNENQSEDLVVQELRKQCGTQLTEIILSDHHSKDEDGRIYITNESEQEYTDLLEHLYATRRQENIIFLAGKNFHEVSNVEALKSKYQKELKSLYYMTRVLSKDKKYSGIHMFLITANAVSATGNEEVILPENAMILGMGKALILENTRIHVKCIDTDVDTEASVIIQEMETNTEEKIVVYRQQERYTQNIGRIKTALKENHIDVKGDGIYLITGGLGGAGMVLAEKLVEKNHQVRIALINRSSFPDRNEWESISYDKEMEVEVEKIERIKKMESMGAMILTICADISDSNRMHEVLNELRTSYGQIHGIIHTAGIAGGGLVMRKEWEDFEKVLYPKVDGTFVLNDLTKDDNLDFFVSFSSYSSIFCEVGQADYIVANSYLDAFAYKKTKDTRKIMTLNWTGLLESGMAVDNQVNQENSTVKFMNNQQVADAFWDALVLEERQVLVGEYDYSALAGEEKQEKLREYLKFDPDIESSLKPYRTGSLRNEIKEVQVSGKTTGKPTETEQKVANIWGKTLGVTEIEYHAKFLEIGGDSLSATYLQKELEKEYPGVMDITDVFVYSSICDMATYIDSRIKPQKQLKTAPKQTQFDQELVELLKMVGSGQMKVEDANKLL